MPNQVSGGGQRDRGIAPRLVLPLTKDSQRALIRGERATPAGQPIERPVTELKNPMPAHNPHTPKLIRRSVQILGEVLSEPLNRPLKRLSAEIANRQRQHPPADMRRK